MAESTMRGMRLGATSLESVRGAALEARLNHEYLCKQGHENVVVLSVEAEIPMTWECRICSSEAYLLVDGTPVADTEESVTSGRSHWQMLLERRSIEELELILEERLEYLRDRRQKLSQG